ncbi:hypothetical protein KC730_00505 [Candidatus Kaiserbacteria bacterium]|nr:hypothetical protein [Candidatus Kaiserbacteria bacterium]
MKPKKIVILGVSASGKTTFSEKLATKTNLPLTRIDSVMWNPGWEYIGDDETVRYVNSIAEQDKWIIEGYIEKEARENLFNKADLILYLDYSGWLSAFRYIKRCLKHHKNPRPELPGSPDKFKFKTLKLIFTKGETWRLEQLIKENDWNNKIIRFKTPKEANDHLARL